MRELIARILNALTAALFRNAERLARLAAVRHVASEYEAAYAEATALEASGKIRLAEALRSELDEALGQGPGGQGADVVPLSLNGAGGGDPFALPGPSPSPSPKVLAGSPEALAGAGEATQANGQPQPQQQRRRGRPPGRTTSGRKSKAKRTAKKAVTEAIIDEGQTSPTLTGAST